MPGIDTGFFIARRLSSRGVGRSGITVGIATATVAVSMAVMVVSLAVIFGFKRDVAARLTGFAGHVEIVNLDGNSSLETQPISRSAALEQAVRRVDCFMSMAPYAIKGGMVKTSEAMQGVMLKGVDATYDLSFFGRALVEGALPAVADSVRTPDILISRSLADMLRIGVDDRTEMLFIQEGRAPRRYAFRVSGIYRTGFEEMDRVTVLTDLRNVQRLNRWEADQVTGYEVNTRDVGRLERFSDGVYGAIVAAEPDGNLMAVSIEQNYPQLFDWLRAHDVNAAVIIAIMIAVALLNMVTAMLIILLERTRMIGELKALGMTNGALQRLFVIRSAAIVLRGMAWGNAVGIALCVVQKLWHPVTLNETGYFLSEVPVRLGAGWLAALNVGAFAVIVGLMVIPTLVVSRIRPDRTIRFQ